MARMHAIIPALAILAIVGCGKKPADTDIDMGSPATQPAVSASEAAPASAPVVAALDLTPVTAGDGKTARVIETCNVEQVNGQAFEGSPVKVPKGSPVSISGWVLDGPASGAAELRLVNLSDASTHKVEVTANLAREDVAESFKADPATTKPGFNVVFNAGNLPAGDYRLQVVVPSADQGAAACDNGRVISLAD